jgi:hypothetical protein
MIEEIKLSRRVTISKAEHPATGESYEIFFDDAFLLSIKIKGYDCYININKNAITKLSIS